MNLWLPWSMGQTDTGSLTMLISLGWPQISIIPYKKTMTIHLSATGRWLMNHVKCNWDMWQMTPAVGWLTWVSPKVLAHFCPGLLGASPLLQRSSGVTLPPLFPAASTKERSFIPIYMYMYNQQMHGVWGFYTMSHQITTRDIRASQWVFRNYALESWNDLGLNSKVSNHFRTGTLYTQVGENIPWQ